MGKKMYCLEIDNGPESECTYYDNLDIAVLAMKLSQGIMNPVCFCSIHESEWNEAGRFPNYQDIVMEAKDKVDALQKQLNKYQRVMKKAIHDYELINKKEEREAWDIEGDLGMREKEQVELDVFSDQTKISNASKSLADYPSFNDFTGSFFNLEVESVLTQSVDKLDKNKSYIFYSDGRYTDYLNICCKANGLEYIIYTWDARTNFWAVKYDSKKGED